jgi:hypothetical protein
MSKSGIDSSVWKLNRIFSRMSLIYICHIVDAFSLGQLKIMDNTRQRAEDF